jgi:hypothetical protein
LGKSCRKKTCFVGEKNHLEKIQIGTGERQGCQIFLDAIYQNDENIPNDKIIPYGRIKFQMSRIYVQQHFLILRLHIGIFGTKINHLASLTSDAKVFQINRKSEEDMKRHNHARQDVS